MLQTSFKEINDNLLKAGQCLALALTASWLNDSEHELVILRPPSSILPFPARDVFCLLTTWPAIWRGVAGLYSWSNFIS